MRPPPHLSLSSAIQPHNSFDDCLPPVIIPLYGQERIRWNSVLIRTTPDMPIGSVKAPTQRPRSRRRLTYLKFPICRSKLNDNDSRHDSARAACLRDVPLPLSSNGRICIDKLASRTVSKLRLTNGSTFRRCWRFASCDVSSAACHLVAFEFRLPMHPARQPPLTRLNHTSGTLGRSSSQEQHSASRSPPLCQCDDSRRPQHAVGPVRPAWDPMQARRARHDFQDLAGRLSVRPDDRL